MPITKSAKKAIRTSSRKRILNMRRKKTMREAIKGAYDGSTTLSAAYQAIDKALKRGVIKKNTAARKKSRVARAYAKKNSA